MDIRALKELPRTFGLTPFSLLPSEVIHAATAEGLALPAHSCLCLSLAILSPSSSAGILGLPQPSHVRPRGLWVDRQTAPGL